MAFQVVFRPRARSDIAVIVAWLARTNTTTADRWRTGLLRIVENLETDPHRYPAADETTDLGVAFDDCFMVADATCIGSYSRLMDKPSTFSAFATPPKISLRPTTFPERMEKQIIDAPKIVSDNNLSPRAV